MANTKSGDTAKILPFRREPAAPPVITQETLRKGIELLAQEWRAVRNMRDFAYRLQLAIDAGAEIEPGELTLDRNLNIERHQPAAQAK